MTSRAKTIWSATLCFAAGLLVLTGSLVSYGTDCPGCRVLAPPDTPWTVWLPNGLAPLAVLIVTITLGVMVLMGKGRDAFLAGFMCGAGLVTMGYFLTYAIHAQFPRGGLFGAGGLIGLAGGILLVSAGLAASRRAQEADR